jgi:hypothetical protein
MKVVINGCYGGFNLSDLAKKELMKHVIKGEFGEDFKLSDMIELLSYSRTVEDRSHPSLVKVVEELGEAANGYNSHLHVVEVDEDAIVPYIENYNGNEWIAEGRKWR